MRDATICLLYLYIDGYDVLLVADLTIKRREDKST
jgi:hypothetical protein